MSTLFYYDPGLIAGKLRLPNAESAVVDLEKLRGYVLDPQHPRGRHKARVFAAALGITTDDAEGLRDDILAAALNHDATTTAHNGYGQRYVLDFPVERRPKRAVVRTTWIVLDNEGFPRLTSCYVR